MASKVVWGAKTSSAIIAQVITVVHSLQYLPTL